MKLIGLAFLFLLGSLSAETLNSISGRHCGIRISMDVRINMDEESIDEEYWPWIAAIYQSGGDGLIFKCTGTLIKPNLVLTSAHCMSEMQSQIAASTIEVHFGKSNLKETKFNKNQIFSADEIIVHPGFNASNFANNLAIIRLSTDATSNDFVQPACLTNANFTETTPTKNELGTVVGWGIKQVTTDSVPNNVQKAFMAVVPNVNCLHNRLSLPCGSFCALYKSDEKSGTAVSSASLIFTENGLYTVRGIMSEVVLEEGRNNGYVVFTEVAKFISWIEETDSAPTTQPPTTTTPFPPTTTTPALLTTTAQNPVCRPNEEFVYDPYRCDETCEGYGNPLCVEYTPEAKCYCKKGFVRLKTVGICVQADNRACRAKMPPTEETCARKENEQLSEWLYDEPCPNTCENYNVPCNVSVPDGMFWGPHCVCKEGFSRLPNKKCVAIKHPKCLEIWKPTSIITTPPPLDSTTRPPRITTMPSLCTNLSTTARTLDKCTDFCGRVVGFEKDCSQFDLGMQYSSAGEILGKHCLSIDYSPRDKYICFNENYGVQIKAYRAIRGMRCIRFVQQYKRKTRRLSSIRSFLCVPHQSPLRFLFSTTGSIPGACCVRVVTYNSYNSHLCVRN